MNKEVKKIREKIKERRDDYRKSNDFISSVKSNLCGQLLSYIDSLQEESVSEELKKFAEEWDESLYRSDAVIAGAKWKEEQMMKKAIEREVKIDSGGYPYIDATELYDYENDKPLAKEGDKIKIIIIKE